jgi:hypothetical protein
MKQFDDDIEKWKGPNPDIPSLVAHGRKLDYTHQSDQRPVLSFSGETSEAWDGEIRNTTKRPDFQGVRKTSGPTVGDLHALDLKTKYEFYFSS